MDEAISENEDNLLEELSRLGDELLKGLQTVMVQINDFKESILNQRISMLEMKYKLHFLVTVAELLGSQVNDFEESIAPALTASQVNDPEESTAPASTASQVQ